MGGSSFSAHSHENRYSSKTNRYSTFNSKALTKLNNESKKSRVTFAALPSDSSFSVNKKPRVTFAVNTVSHTAETEEIKEIEAKSDISSDISSQSDDLLDHIYNDQGINDF